MTPSEPIPAGRRIGCAAISMTGASLGFLLALLLLGLGLYLRVELMSSRLERHKGLGAKLPALELQSLTGADQTLSLAELKGKVVLVNFWGTWCPPCRAELPQLARLCQDLQHEPDFRFLAVSCGSGGPEDLQQLRDETQGFLEQESLDLPTWADADRTTRKAFHQVAELQGYPTTFILDRQGAIRAIWTGYSPGLTVVIKQHLTRLLHPQSDAPSPPPENP